MFNDPSCLDRVGTMLAGAASVAALTATAPAIGGITAVALATHILQMACSGRSAVLGRLAGRKAQPDAVLANYLRAYKENWQPWAGHASLTDEGDVANAVLSFEEYFREARTDLLPEPSEIMGLMRDADAIAGRMLDHAARRDRGRYGDTALNQRARDFFRRVIAGGLRGLFADPGFAQVLQPAFQETVLRQLGAIKNDTETLIQGQAEARTERRHQTALVEEMLRRLPMTDEEKARVIALADRIAEDVTDIDTAVRELERAVEIAERVQAEGRAGSNLGDFMDEVLRRVAELSAASYNDGAAAEIDAALAREEAESRARQICLLHAGLEQDILRRDPESAARRLVRKAELELPEGGSLYALLWSNFALWYESGRDKGLNFDLCVAIELARRTCDVTDDPDEHGTALNDLGAALGTVGEWEAGTKRLKQAVAAYRLALEVRKRERVPLDWAMTQMNLGNALRALGQREAGNERLEQAVAAYRLALEEQTRERVPLDWATTQMNLGNALSVLGQREYGTEALDQAVVAYRLALEKRPRERVPLDWAMVQGNLCIVELAFFDKTGEATHLDAAERYLAAAREEFEEAGATQYLAQADELAAKIAQRRGG